MRDKDGGVWQIHIDKVMVMNMHGFKRCWDN